jgi:hypothetical protein
MAAHQVSHRVVGRSSVHTQDFGQVFVDALFLIEILAPAETRNFRKITPPQIA